MRAVVLNGDKVMNSRDLADPDHFLLVVYPSLHHEVCDLFESVYADVSHADYGK